MVKQVFAQPFYQFVEQWARNRWPDNTFLAADYAVSLPLCGDYNINYFRLIWRTVYVIITAILAMLFPFFNDFVGLLGAFGFWPLTVYFPTEMYMAHQKIKRFSATWIGLKMLSWVCLIVSIGAAMGSIQGLVKSVTSYKPFQTRY